MTGYFGKILFINLSCKKFFIYDLDINIANQYIGGKGVALKYLLDEQEPNTPHFSEDNLLIFAFGPCTDTFTYGSSRYGVYTKSPLTGFLCESYSGGKAPQKMSRCGYDLIIIKGKAEKLTYLLINEDNVSFLDATELKGVDCHSTELILKDKHKNASVLCIGPAGENLIPFAIISNDLWRCAGRAGAGAIMGSKNLKALVFEGNKKRKIFDAEGLKSFSKYIFSKYKDSATAIAYREMGTPMMVDLVNQIGGFPTMYWHKGFFEKHTNINADAMKKNMKVSSKACANCFIACGKLSVIKDGKYKGLKIEGPEYETIYAFGGLCMIDDIREITYINDLCDKLGVDTITMGNLCALTIEASLQGKIKEKLSYGNCEQIIEIIKSTVEKKGIGSILSNGIIYASKEFNMEDQAIHVKGLEPAGYDPRVFKGMALSYAISDRGACHLRTTFYKAELAGISPPDKLDDKVEILLDFENRLTLMDSMIVCRFFRDFYQWDEISEIIYLTTGNRFSKDQLYNIATKITNMAREFNEREGLTPLHDNLPERLFNEPLPDIVNSITKREFEILKNQYYQRKNWKTSKGGLS